MADTPKTIGLKHCPKGHILGQMRRNGSGLDVLELYRQAIDYGQDMPETVDVIAVVVAGHLIRCNICGAVVDWHQGRARHGSVWAG